jgi:hypothetical protein
LRVEATSARAYDEVAATKIMLDRTERCFDIRSKRPPDCIGPNKFPIEAKFMMAGEPL